MKRRCIPLRADHNLLTPNTHTQLGVSLHPIVQVKSEGVASLFGHLTDSSRKEAPIRLPRQGEAASPTRRLRFEDETVTQAESRYLERQQHGRRAGQRVSGILVPRPDLNLHARGRVEAGPLVAADSKQQGLTGMTAGQCDSCREVLAGVDLDLRMSSLVSDEGGRSCSHLNLWTEPIKETYIGSVASTNRGMGAARERPNTLLRTSQVELNVNQEALLKATPTTDLPINPYGPYQLFTSSAMRSQSAVYNRTKEDQDQEEQQRPAAAKTHRELPSRLEVEKSPCVDLQTQKCLGTETTAKHRTLPTPDNSSDGQVRLTARAEPGHDLTALPKKSGSREDSSRLLLRRLLSSVTLRTRSSSLDRFTIGPPSTVLDPTSSDRACTGHRRSSCPSKKLPPALLLGGRSPNLQLRKSLSVQSFEEGDHSPDYWPAADCVLKQCPLTEDVGHPSSLHTVGRVLQVSTWMTQRSFTQDY